ncbi:MAG: hypothetical protein IPP58_09355 [Holophagaceae bacterium]|uniref:Outer membrane efflux protein n=1 Tax=Candidatus Geothrix skivensis TaxID=2954439 RepID=A0A9D7SFI1_9BACT|nr:hypothetical protein [Candidatus Geothrix skivensis]
MQTLLRQRTEERRIQIQSLRRTRDLYRDGLLVQSEASFKAALAQYEAGRAPFLGALEALNGWVGDQGAYLQTQAQLQAQHIALAEAALGTTTPINGGSSDPPASPVADPRLQLLRNPPPRPRASPRTAAPPP